MADAKPTKKPQPTVEEKVQELARAEERAIHKHAFWLYGVLVGVAIKEALETSIHHFVNPARIQEELAHLGQRISYPDSEIGLYPEIIRLTAFLVLIIRFYFGSAYFFGAAYQSRKAHKRFPITNYGMDFIFGFIHFVSFVILALLIDIHTTAIHGFPYLVGFILVYDIFWYVSSVRRSTKAMIFWWMIINLITALTAGLVYVLLERRNVITAEIWALWIVIGVSVLDIGMMMAKRPFFLPIGKLVPPDISDEPSDSPDPAEPIPE